MHRPFQISIPPIVKINSFFVIRLSLRPFSVYLSVHLSVQKYLESEFLPDLRHGPVTDALGPVEGALEPGEDLLGVLHLFF